VEQKFERYPEILETLKFDAEIKLVMDCYKIYIKLKKTKHKNKQQLILYQMAMNAMQSTDKFIKAAINEMLVKYYFDDLKDFLSKDNNSILLHSAGCNDFQLPEQLTLAVDLISKTMYLFKSLPALQDISHLKNTNIIKTEDANNNPLDDTLNNVIELELFKVPRAQTLAATQIKQIREELSDILKVFYESLFNFNKTNYPNLFNSDAFNNVLEFENNTSNIISEIQNIIDNNIYLSQSRNNNPTLEDVMITLNFTTNDNLINIYKESDLITNDASLYIKEMITKFSNLNTLTTFLTFKNINHV